MLLAGTQNGTATMENNQWFFTMSNIPFIYDTTILLLGIYPNIMKNFIYTNIRQKLVTGVFKIAKTRNNQNIPLLKNGQTDYGASTHWYATPQCKGTTGKCSNTDDSQMHYSK